MQFEHNRSRLRAVAFRMLGSAEDADDALQEAWLRVHDCDARGVDNMRAWLTTVVGRVCLNMLRERRSRRELLTDTRVADPFVTLVDGERPEDEVVLAESVGPALLMALEALSPAERFAFVLHDVFGVRFAELASALDRSESAVQQLASRGRRRLREVPSPDADLTRQRELVDAFFAASRDGDFQALMRILHPDVDLRIDGGALQAGTSVRLRGARAVAGYTATYARLFPFVRPALVNGAGGAIVVIGSRAFSFMGFRVTNDRITGIEALTDPQRLARLGLDLG